MNRASRAALCITAACRRLRAHGYLRCEQCLEHFLREAFGPR